MRRWAWLRPMTQPTPPSPLQGVVEGASAGGGAGLGSDPHPNNSSTQLAAYVDFGGFCNFGDFVWHRVDFKDVAVELMLTRLVAAADVAVLAGGGGPPRRKELCAMEVLPRFVMHAEERKCVRKRGRCYVVVERSSVPFVGNNGGFEF